MKPAQLATLLASLTTLAFASAPARAELPAQVTAQAGPPAAAAPDESSIIEVGLLLGGTASGSFDLVGDHVEAASAFVMSPYFERRAGEYLRWEAQSNVILGVQGEGAETSATQVDVLGRFGFRVNLKQQVDLYGYLGLGYSAMFMPEGLPSMSGAVIRPAGGLSFDLGPSTTLRTELAYQAGFFSTDKESRVAMAMQTDYVMFSVGLGQRF
jgi:hypothetical protein